MEVTMGTRILVVEDEAITATDIQDIVEKLGYQVSGPVMSAPEAISLAKAENPNLALMDIRLKGSMTGIEAAARIWDEHKIPTIFLTALSDESTLARAKVLNPYGYVLKPFEEADLKAAIEMALHRQVIENKRDRSANSHSVSPQAQLASVKFGSKDHSPAEFLQRVDPFRKLPPADLQELAQASSFRAIKAGAHLCHQSEDCQSCFVVVSGRVACVQSSADGHELIIALIPPGDIFGLSLAVSEDEFPFSVVAQRDSEILSIPRSMLKLILHKHPALYQEFADDLRTRLFRMNDLAVRLAHEKVEVRIASVLDALIVDFGTYRSEQDNYAIDLTRQELAECSGTTPETAIRTTKAMERDGILDLTTPACIVVRDRAALRQIGQC